MSRRRRGRPEMMIRARGIGKRYGTVSALDDVDLDVRADSVMCLLGHNGAGKTTLVQILATLTRASTGWAEVAGYDVAGDGHQVRRRIGITGQFASLDEKATGTENLVLVARLLGADRITARLRAAELLAVFDLADAAERAVSEYSGGMRRRLDLAASLVGQPAVVFLDEPTAGLDPISRHHAWGLIRRLTQDGTTVLLTTQDLEEAERLADEITVLARGRRVAGGTPSELKAQIGNRSILVTPRTPEQIGAVLPVLERAGFAPALDIFRGAVAASAARPQDLMQAAEALNAAGIDYAGIALAEPTLHDVYRKLAVEDQAAGRPAVQEAS